MTPNIILAYYGGGGIIVIVIISIILGIIRIIRAATKDKSSGTNYQNYQSPYQQPGVNNPNAQNNPAANPFGQAGHPYQNQGPQYNDPNQPPPFPNTQTYSPPQYNTSTGDYTQPTMNPGAQYTPPEYSQPGYNPNPAGQKRSTNIGGTQQYSTHMSQMPEPKNRTGLVLGIIFGALALIGGLGWFIYMKSEAAKKFTTTDFNLGYDNQTDDSYTIILDDWDTIQVEPWTGSRDIDYTVETVRDTFHWKILTEHGDVVVDTFLMRDDLEEWYYDQQGKGYSETPTIILNPSRTQYVFWTLWYGSAGDYYCEDTQFGDSTYWVDAYTTTEAVIFDERDPDWAKDLGEAEKYSADDEAEFMLTITEFHNLYHRIFSPDKDELDVFNDYRNSLIELYNETREDALDDGYMDYSEEQKLIDFDATIPPSVTSNTDANDFADAIDYINQHSSFFEDAAYRKYTAVTDSADIILQSGFTAHARNEPFHEMEYITYYVTMEGFWNDEPKRTESYTEHRDRDGDLAY